MKLVSKITTITHAKGPHTKSKNVRSLVVLSFTWDKRILPKVPRYRADILLCLLQRDSNKPFREIWEHRKRRSTYKGAMRCRQSPPKPLGSRRDQIWEILRGHGNLCYQNVAVWTFDKFMFRYTKRLLRSCPTNVKEDECMWVLMCYNINNVCYSL